MSGRCRADPEFALAVYERIATDRGRAMFLEIYGASLVRATSSTGKVRTRVPERVAPEEWEPENAIPPPPPSSRRDPP